MRLGWLAVVLVVLPVFSTDVPAAERVPVVVELFTSEGCSSCPPADALLAQLSREQAGAAEIIALGEHVDYWNELGWKDRFAARQYTQRQEEYARRFNLDSVYTPQMVIDGRKEFVGNDQSAVRRLIAEATRTRKPVEVNLELDGNQANVALKQSGTGTAAVLLAVTEDNLTTQVGSGENGGRRLVHQAVVRSFRQIGTLHGSSFAGREPLKLDNAWVRSNVRVLVLAQDPSTGAILGAASKSLR
jgi:hypothetical protein